MHENLLADLRHELEAVLIQHGDAADGAHDVHHARRVCNNALAIATHSGAGDKRLLVAAAYLHDLVNLPKDSPQRAEASALSAQAARPLLTQLGFKQDDNDAVCHCIEAHSFSRGLAPASHEARILQDADRLESLGALGIARTFFTAGKLDSTLFHGDDPFARQRELDDLAFALDHFQKKLLTLAASMQTDSGKVIANERTAVMRDFLQQLAGELGTDMPW